MKLLITGGAGFIGSNFINYWLTKYTNDKVINLDSMSYAANPLTVKRHQKNFGNKYRFVEGDICDKNLVESLVKEVDIIVHFAAESHVDRSITNPEDFIQTNIIGTHTLLEAVKKNNLKRFHYISTDEVFGSLPLNSGKRFTENSNYDPRSPYAASKASAEHFVFTYYHTFGLPITVTNCSNNYGPFCFPEKVIPLCIIRALKNKPIPIYGKGIAIRDYLHVEDHCSAIETVLLKAKPGSRYCVGGNSPKNTVEVVEQILTILKKPHSLIHFTPDRLGHDMQYLTDHSKITRELGWESKFTFEEGIKDTIKWYQENKDWWEPISSRAEDVAEKYLAKK